MDADQSQWTGKHSELTRQIISSFYEVYNELGYGFLESVYRESMRIAMTQSGLNVQTEVSVPVTFRNEVVGIFRADMIVNNIVLIELKALDGLLRQHESQTMNYLKATNIEVALLMNFGKIPTFKRLIMDNEVKQMKAKSVSSFAIRVKPLPAAKVTA